MFKTLGFEYDHMTPTPTRKMTLKIQKFFAQARHEKTDKFWEARQGFMSMQKMVESAPLMTKFTKSPVFKTLVPHGVLVQPQRRERRQHVLVPDEALHAGNRLYGRRPRCRSRSQNEGIYHPAHKGMFTTPAEYLAWYEPWFQAKYGKKAWDRIGFITHDLFLPDWNHPVMDAAIEELGKTRRRRDLLDDRRVQRPHRVAHASARSEDAQAARVGDLSQRSAVSRGLDVRRFARSDDRAHSRSR